MRAAAIAATILAGCAGPRAKAPGSDYGEEWRAARDCFDRANGILHEGLLADRASDLPGLVDADERLQDPLKEKLSAAAEEGAGHGEAAVALKPDGVEGQLYLALNLAFYGLTVSHAAGLMQGLPARLQTAYGKAIEIDPSYESGGAFRLKGKFLMSAPWPVRDRAEARKALDRANEIAQVRENFLFLGDLSYQEGRLDEAVAMWQRACSTPEHPATAAIDAAVLELARRRLAAAASNE